MHDCACPYIVSFYGAFQNDSGDVVMCMEYMDCGYAPSDTSGLVATLTWH